MVVVRREELFFSGSANWNSSPVSLLPALPASLPPPRAAGPRFVVGSSTVTVPVSDWSNNLYSSNENFGVGATTNNWGGRLFTASQRKELERQKIVYKYMAASVPIPSEFLVPVNCGYRSNGVATSFSRKS